MQFCTFSYYQIYISYIFIMFYHDLFNKDTMKWNDIPYLSSFLYDPIYIDLKVYIVMRSGEMSKNIWGSEQNLCHHAGRRIERLPK